jgi:hypothetical protein
LYPLKNQLIIIFEHHCYKFYAVNLGLQSILSLDNSNDTNDNEYDNSNIKSEEITKYDSNTTDCSIYYFSGYVLRAMMGLLSRGISRPISRMEEAAQVDAISVNGKTEFEQIQHYTSDELEEIQRNIFNSFCVTSSMAEADGLPVDIVHDRCTTRYENLLYVNRHFFDNLLQLEKDVISKILDDTRLLIFLGDKVCHYIEKKTLCHESYNNLLEMIDESLSSCDFWIEEGEKSAFVKILCDKFFDVYLNIAYNDLVLSALPRKMKNNSVGNVPFRLQVQLKSEGVKN